MEKEHDPKCDTWNHMLYGIGPDGFLEEEPLDQLKGLFGKTMDAYTGSQEWKERMLSYEGIATTGSCQRRYV